MARRVTAGKAGGESIAGIQAITPTTLTAADNVDIIVDPEGTGRFLVGSPLVVEDQYALRFEENDSNGDNYVAFQAPASISANVTWTLPNADGSSNQVLTTNGSGTLSWGAPQTSISDNNSDSGTNYILFHNSTSATGTLRLATTTRALTYQPSTGTLSSTLFNETSSIALKENFDPIVNALDKILKLQAYTYDRKDGSIKGEAGLVAEDVNAIIPNIVQKDANGNPVSIAYQRLTAYLIESIKELKLEIDSLKGR